MTNEKIQPYVPIQHRPPNVFLRHEMRRFEYGHGSGIIRIAHYLNKKKQPCEVEAQVIWDKQPFSK